MISSITPIQTPSVGSSSSSIRGFDSSARPIASILRSPPDNVPADLVQPLAEFRKHRQHPIDGLAVAVGQRADREIVAHREPPEHRMFLRHVAEPQAHALLGRQLVDVAPVEADGAAGSGSSPTIVFISVVLPAPLRPRTATPPRQGTPSVTSNSTWLRP